MCFIFFFFIFTYTSSFQHFIHLSLYLPNLFFDFVIIPHGFSYISFPVTFILLSILGGDLAPRPPYRYGPPPDFSRPIHPQQMHYPPSYPPYYYGQHPPPPPVTHQDLCYPYYPPKYYPTNSPYARRPYVSPSYYQPPPLVPQNAPQQIVPAAPTPQHIDPHYTSSPYYPSPSPYNTSGQCYSQTPPRNLQPPYLGEEKYDKFMTKSVTFCIFDE